MYVMQSLPHDQQGLASGIFITLIRLSSTVEMGIATAVYSSMELAPSNATDPMRKFTLTFWVSVAFSAASVLLVPFIRIGTQGHHAKQPAVEEAQIAETAEKRATGEQKQAV